MCVRNDGYEASLERNKIYAVLPDEEAERDGDVRVIDESGDVTGKVYGVWGPPTVYIVDRQGRLVGRATGPRPWDGPAGRRFIEALLAAPATP